jgi:hypothetical protein
MSEDVRHRTNTIRLARGNSARPFIGTALDVTLRACDRNVPSRRGPGLPTRSTVKALRARTGRPGQTHMTSNVCSSKHDDCCRSSTRTQNTTHHTIVRKFAPCALCDTLQSHTPPSRRPVAVPRQPFAIPVADYPVCVSETHTWRTSTASVKSTLDRSNGTSFITGAFRRGCLGSIQIPPLAHCRGAVT